MKGNSLFLVCEICRQENQADFGVKLAERSVSSAYTQRIPKDQFNNWLAKHRHKGMLPDHFKLAHQQPMNADQGTEEAVKLAIVR